MGVSSAVLSVATVISSSTSWTESKKEVWKSRQGTRWQQVWAWPRRVVGLEEKEGKKPKSTGTAIL